MEALAAVGLASSIVAFLDFGGKIIKHYREISNSATGATTENAELQHHTQVLQDLAGRLVSSDLLSQNQRTLSSSEKSLRKVGLDCVTCSKELLVLLKELKDEFSGHRHLSIIVIFLSQKKKRAQVEELAQRLSRLQVELNTAFLDVPLDRMSKMGEELQKLRVLDQRMKGQTCQTLNAMLVQLKSMEKTPKLDDLAEEIKNVRRYQNVLSSLYFQEMADRHRKVTFAHPRTLGWIYDEKASHNFPYWLISEEGIYWVRGKAGSGKSTLMRYVVEHSSTEEYLSKWTGGKKLVIASHFFWHSGIGMQKSRTGLLQTILFQILRQCPELIPQVCGQRGLLPGSLEEPWTEEELSTALRKLPSSSSLSLKFCFFIDGLDEYTDGDEEYQGTHQELVDLIREIAKSPSIKVCVSSRPWNQFLQAFDSMESKLCIEDLNKDAIRLYARDKLQLDTKFDQRSRADPKYNDLLEDIIKKAQGVFLWVSLVVNSLVRGLLNDDTFRTLQKRLDEFPAGLEEYFLLMIRNIEPIYAHDSARIFSICLNTRQTLPLLAFHLLELEGENPSFIVDMTKDSALDLDLKQVLETTKHRVNARTKDLLEVTHDENQEEPMLQDKVDFLHRTVADFFRKRDILRIRFGPTGTKYFDHSLTLSRILLGLTKVYVSTAIETRVATIFGFADEIMYHSVEIERIVTMNASETSAFRDLQIQELSNVLEELDRFNSRYYSSNSGHWTCRKEPPNGLFQEWQQKNFLATAIQFGLGLYVRRKLAESPLCLSSKRGRPLLDYALRPKMVTPLHLEGLDFGPDEMMVEILLEAGADPNQAVYIYKQQTVWVLYLQLCYAHFKDFRPYAEKVRVYRNAKLMIEKGASPHARFRLSSDIWIGIPEVFDQVGLGAQEKGELMAILEKQKRRSWLPFASYLSRFR